jgi:hypothetical protein
MVILVSTAPLVDRTSVQQYNRNGNTSEYCFISGQNIGTKGMVILVSTASLVVRISNGAILTSIIIPVVLMFCPLMEQYSLVLPFLLYWWFVH